MDDGAPRQKEVESVMAAEPPYQPGLSSIDFFGVREKSTLLLKPLSAEVNPDQNRTLTLDLSCFQCQDRWATSEENSR